VSALPRPSTRLPRERPAETTAAAGAAAFLICYLAGVDDPAVLAALGVLIGLIPGIVTWIVTLRQPEGTTVAASPSRETTPTPTPRRSRPKRRAPDQ